MELGALTSSPAACRCGPKWRSVVGADAAFVDAVRLLADRRPELDAHVLVDLRRDARPVFEPSSRGMNPETLACLSVVVPGRPAASEPAPVVVQGATRFRELDAADSGPLDSVLRS